MDTEKLSMMKALKKVEIEGTFLHIIKNMYDKLIANIILNGKKLKPFPLKSGIHSLLLFSIVPKFLPEK
jgi:hypothetical protein